MGVYSTTIGDKEESMLTFNTAQRQQSSGFWGMPKSVVIPAPMKEYDLSILPPRTNFDVN